MKNRVKEFWIWYWGDEDGIIGMPDSHTFVDFDNMKIYSSDHAVLFKGNYRGYWSSYTKIEI